MIAHLPDIGAAALLLALLAANTLHERAHRKRETVEDNHRRMTRVQHTIDRIFEAEYRNELRHGALVDADDWRAAA